MRCRICLGDGGLHSRCSCGDASYFHDQCLVKWIRTRGTRCEICGGEYRGLEKRSRVWRVAPNQLVAVCVDCGGFVVADVLVDESRGGEGASLGSGVARPRPDLPSPARRPL